MDLIELDSTLKLLNGFHNNSLKRSKLINSIKEKGRISIFAYGSLLWNPIEHYDYFISNCILNNYEKGFFCEDFIYRGTSSFTGLTMALKKNPNSNVNGALLLSRGKKIIDFIKSFVKRETPMNSNGILMDIYKYDLVKVYLPDRIHFEYSITCIVNQKSFFYLNNKLTIEEQATKMTYAHGINGTNFDYLFKLNLIYQKLNINDSFTKHFQTLLNTINKFQSYSSINSQKHFIISELLNHFEEQYQTLQNSNQFSSSQLKQISSILLNIE